MPEMQEQLRENSQAHFGGGLNAQAAPHLLGENEVQLSTNVDFSLEWGALICRRGSIQLGTLGIADGVGLITRNYNGTQSSLDASPWYIMAASGETIYRGTGSTTITLTSIGSGDLTNQSSPPQAVSYQQWQYLAQGSVAIRDNGTNSYTWIIPQPSQPLARVTFQGSDTSYLGPFSIANGSSAFSGTWSNGAGGQQGSGGRFVSAGGAPVLSTFTNGTNGTATDSGIVAIATVVGTQTYTYTSVGTTVLNTNFNHPATLANPNSGAFLSTSSSLMDVIGNYGVDYLTIGFSNPNAVAAISVDYSIWDTNFFNYWHAETTLNQIGAATPDPTAQILAAQGNASFDAVSSALSRLWQTKNPRPGQITGGPAQPNPRQAASIIQSLPNGVTTWAIPRTNYQLVGTLGSANPSQTGWESIAAIRVSIQTIDQTAMVVGTPVTYGRGCYSLNDTTVGYNWFQTHARVENGVVVAEGDPSPISIAINSIGLPTGLGTTPQMIQYGSASLNLEVVTASITAAGVTHQGIYRQGGLLPDAYLIDYIPLVGVGTTASFFDTSYPDAPALYNGTMTRSLWGSWPVTGVNAISEPFQDRIFIGTGNSLFWSQPGNPLAIEADSDVTVSVEGDPIQALIPWDRLIIVNNASVYEIDGSIWEGPNQDWTLRRTGAKRGTAAAKTCIKTPYGVVLFGYDGISLYYPGYGVDTPLTWVYEKFGDLWRGNGVGDPAAQKGRLQAINYSAISSACATYMDQKIYIALPCGASTYPNTMLVLDMSKSEGWVYDLTNLRGIETMFYDYGGGRLTAGNFAGAGTIYQIETGLVDSNGGQTFFGTWTGKTRAWSTNKDLVLENISIEAQVGGIGDGSSSIVVEAIIDNTSTRTVGTLTGTAKQWYSLPLNGTIGNNISFQFAGRLGSSSSQQGVYQLGWETLVQPQKTAFFLTEHFSLKNLMYWQPGMEAWWHDWLTEMDCLGGTVLATLFIDNVAIQTNTLTGSGKLGYNFALPTETYGNEAQVQFNAQTGTVSGTVLPGLFKHYRTWYNYSDEPTRALFFESPLVPFPSETYIKTWLPDINPLGGTVTGTLLVDGVGISTQTMTGTLRKIWEWGLPNVTVGKMVHSLFSGTVPFKYWPRGAAEWEFEPKPYDKTTWLVTYKKLGGITQLDLARFYAMDIEAPLGAVLTNTWIIDGAVFSTNTFVLSSLNAGENYSTNVARMYADQIPFPPGGRGYLFQQQLTSTSPFKVWRSNIDIDRVGVKGLSRVTLNGTPSPREGLGGSGG